MASQTHSFNWKTITNKKNFGSQELDEDLIPVSNNFYDIGNSSKQWGELYVYNGFVVQALSVGTNLTVGGNCTISGTLIVNALNVQTLTTSGQTDLADTTGTTSIGATTKLTISTGGLLTVANTSDISGTTASITTSGGIYCTKRLSVASSNTGIITPAFSVVGSAYFGDTVTSLGLITGSNGLSISSGTSSLQATTSTTFSSTSVTTLASVSGTTTIGSVSPVSISAAGILTVINAFNVTFGTSSLKDTLVTTFTSTGATNLAILSGITTIGSTTPATISSGGLITSQNGLTVSSGTSTLQATTSTSLSSTSTTTLASSSGTTTIGASTPVTVSTGGTLTVADTTEVSGSSASITTSGGIYCAKRLSVASANTGIVTPAFRVTGSSYLVGAVTCNTTLGVNSTLTSSGLITGQNGLTISVGSTSVGALTTSGTITASTSSTNPYSFSSTGSSTDNRLVISCVNAGTAGTPGISLQRGATALEKAVLYIDSSNNFNVFGNGKAANIIATDCTTGQVFLPFDTSFGSTSGTCTIGASTPATISTSGLITSQNGLTVSSGTTSLQATTISGNLNYKNFLYTANPHINTTNFTLTQAECYASYIFHTGTLLGIINVQLPTVASFTNLGPTTGQVITFFYFNNTTGGFSTVLTTNTGWTFPVSQTATVTNLSVLKVYLIFTSSTTGHVFTTLN